METILTTHFAADAYRRIDTYREFGGYDALRKALSMTPEGIIDEVKKANLRGRGRAGFPAGVKWGFLPKDLSRPRVLVVNADEGEPGTFKDRLIMSRGPHLMIEGIVIASIAMRLHLSYVYIRGNTSARRGSSTRRSPRHTRPGSSGRTSSGPASTST